MPKICESVKGYTIMLMYSLGSHSKDVYFPVLSLINFSQSIGSSLNGTLSTPGSGNVVPFLSLVANTNSRFISIPHFSDC